MTRRRQGQLKALSARCPTQADAASQMESAHKDVRRPQFGAVGRPRPTVVHEEAVMRGRMKHLKRMTNCRTLLFIHSVAV